MRTVIVTLSNLTHCLHWDVFGCFCVCGTLLYVNAAKASVCELQGCGPKHSTATWHGKVSKNMLSGYIISTLLKMYIKSTTQPWYSGISYNSWNVFLLLLTLICGSDYLHPKYWILFWCKWCSSTVDTHHDNPIAGQRKWIPSLLVCPWANISI